MQTFIVKFIPNDIKAATVIHKIIMPKFNDKDFYRTMVSWNGFSTGKRKGATKEERKTYRDRTCWSPTGLYYTHDAHEDEWLERIRHRMEWIKQRTDLDEKQMVQLLTAFDETKFPTVKHASLYDFYDYIGFDRKARKYRKSSNLA